MESELRDQGKALSRRAAAGADAASRAAELLADADCEYVLIAARGSSDNAARYAQYLLGTTAGMSVALAAPWLFGHGHDPPRLDGAAVIGISQSGRSPDVVSVIAAARAQGRPTIAITNDPGSGLAARSDVGSSSASAPSAPSPRRRPTSPPCTRSRRSRRSCAPTGSAGPSSNPSRSW